MKLKDPQVQDIVSHVRSLEKSVSADQVENAIRSYEVLGPDRGGNELGITGTYIAMCVDRIRQGRPLID